MNKNKLIKFTNKISRNFTFLFLLQKLLAKRFKTKLVGSGRLLQLLASYIEHQLFAHLKKSIRSYKFFYNINIYFI